MVQGIFTLATFISYGLQCYVPVEIIWGTYLSKRFEGKLKWEFVVRISIVLVTCKALFDVKNHKNPSLIYPFNFLISVLLAISVPRLALFISLFGALCLSVLGIAFPAVMEICVLWPNNLGRFNIVVIRNVVLIIIGGLGLVIGTYKSLFDIVQSFQPPVNVLNATINGIINNNNAI